MRTYSEKEVCKAVEKALIDFLVPKNNDLIINQVIKILKGEIN
jgi:hypothetical protein